MGVLCLQLKAIAPEYYETLAYHTSWTWVTWKFLSDPEVGPWTRMRRPTREAAPAPATPDKASALVRPLPRPAPLLALFMHAVTDPG